MRHALLNVRVKIKKNNNYSSRCEPGPPVVGFAKRYKFEILQHILQSFEFSNFATRKPFLRLVKFLSVLSSFLSRYHKVENLDFSVQTQMPSIKLILFPVFSSRTSLLIEIRFKLLSTLGVS